MEPNKVQAFDFEIRSAGPVSAAFRKIHCPTFSEASHFIRHLPYRRNRDKANALAPLLEGCGTCSTKHALLKRLADENKIKNVRLMLGIFNMNGTNTPPLRDLLEAHGLTGIPEAHNYLKIDSEVLDCTRPGAAAVDFMPALWLETEIDPADITDFKVAFHQKFLSQHFPDRNLEEIWAIREHCISLLSSRPGN